MTTGIAAPPSARDFVDIVDPNQQGNPVVAILPIDDIGMIVYEDGNAGDDILVQRVSGGTYRLPSGITMEQVKAKLDAKFAENRVFHLLDTTVPV